MDNARGTEGDLLYFLIGFFLSYNFISHSLHDDDTRYSLKFECCMGYNQLNEALVLLGDNIMRKACRTRCECDDSSCIRLKINSPADSIFSVDK